MAALGAASRNDLNDISKPFVFATVMAVNATATVRDLTGQQNGYQQRLVFSQVDVLVLSDLVTKTASFDPTDTTQFSCETCPSALR